MDTNGPQTFRLDPERQKVAVRQRLRWIVPYMMAVAGGAMWFMWYLGQGRPGAMSGQTAIISFAVVVGVLAFTVVRATGRASRSYRLILGEDWLRIEVDQLTPIEVRRSEVRAIRETAGGLQIHRATGLPVGITRSVDGYLEIRDRLMSWAPATGKVRSQMWFGVGGVAAVFGWFGLGGLSSLATTPAASLALAGGSAACALGLWWMFRELPTKRRNLVRGFLLLQAVAILFLNVLRWVGPPR